MCVCVCVCISVVFSESSEGCVHQLDWLSVGGFSKSTVSNNEEEDEGVCSKVSSTHLAVLHLAVLHLAVLHLAVLQVGGAQADGKNGVWILFLFLKNKPAILSQERRHIEDERRVQ